jgi:hypothetical protein
MPVTNVNTIDLSGTFLSRTTDATPVQTQNGPMKKHRLQIQYSQYHPALIVEVLGDELLRKGLAQGVTGTNQKVVVRCKLASFDSGKGYAPMPILKPYDFMSREFYISLDSPLPPAETTPNPVQPQPVISEAIDGLLSPNPATAAAATVPPGGFTNDDDLPF